MRIGEGALPGTRIDRQHDVDSTRGSTTGRTQSTAVQDGGDSAAAGELAQLVAAVNSTDEIRPGLIEEVSRRLAAGYYDTPESAGRTADAILGSAG